MSKKNKIDCVHELCRKCGELPSCLRAALLTKDGEYVAYIDLCYYCAFRVLAVAGMEGAETPSDLRVHYERTLQTK